MIIAVASGKGGTGKTTVATSLALSLAPQMPVQLLDGDVEAPNAHLFLRPSMEQRTLATIPVPVIDSRACTHCGKCAEVCQYHAITVIGGKVLVFHELCHGCGSCTLNCPEHAIREVPRPIGTLESGRAQPGLQVARGVLRPGQALAVPVIRQLREWMPPRPGLITIIDAPPGTSCPVIAAVHGADYMLLVTEPTPFGLHDLRLAHEVAQTLGLPAGVVINRDGIGDTGVDDYCARHDLPVLMRIPYDAHLAARLAAGTPLVDVYPDYRPRFREMFEQIAAGQEEAA